MSDRTFNPNVFANCSSENHKMSGTTHTKLELCFDAEFATPAMLIEALQQLDPQANVGIINYEPANAEHSVAIISIDVEKSVIRNPSNNPTIR